MLPHFGLEFGIDDPYLVPVGLELVGHDAGERGADMLAHFGAFDVDGHSAIAVDAVPDGRFKKFAGGCLLTGRQRQLDGRQRRPGVSRGQGLQPSDKVRGLADDPALLRRVEQGKGKKDHYVILSPNLLELLREW